MHSVDRFLLPIPSIFIPLFIYYLSITMADNNRKIRCQEVWKIFGPNPESVFELLEQGTSKQELLEQTGHVIAIRNVSFEVQENEVFVVMGLSGSGKSTLVRCINRLMEPTRGSIYIDDVNIAQMNDQELRELRRQRLSMVFQNFGLLPHRTVFDNVAFGLEVRGDKRDERHKKSQDAINLVGLKGWENSRIGELSGGMQQRVGFARALAVGSEILLMDEPFSALDPLIRRQMQEEFLNLRQQLKKTVIFITHDLLEALTLGDRVAIMRDGEVVQLGTPEEIVTNPSDDYVREFVKDVPRGKVLPVSNIIEEPLLVVKDEQSVNDAIGQMEKKEADYAFVVDGTGIFKGVITKEQAATVKNNGAVKTGEIIEQECPTALSNATLEHCLQLVAECDIPVAILDEAQHLQGMVTRTAIIQATGGNGTPNGANNKH